MIATLLKRIAQLVLFVVFAGLGVGWLFLPWRIA